MDEAGSKLISESEFENKWFVKARPDGELFGKSDLSDVPLNRIWTVYEVEDMRNEGANYLHWYAMPGLVPLVAIGYLVTEKSWRGDTPHAVWYWDDDECAAIERFQST